jgi:hypothetical protein
MLRCDTVFTVKTFYKLALGGVLVGALALVGGNLGRFQSFPARYQGRTAKQWLALLYTGKSGLADALRPHQVLTGEEPGIITFELPINYDFLHGSYETKRTGDLVLYIDGHGIAHCFRAADGNCDLCWNRAELDPKAHFHEVQVQMLVGSRSGGKMLDIRGESLRCELLENGTIAFSTN